MPRTHAKPATPARRARPATRTAPATRIQPHDRLFRAVFAQPRHIANLLRNLLPPILVAALDFSKLTVEVAELIGGDLGEQRPDLIVRIPLAGQDAFIYVLVEHQSDRDAMMPYRVARATGELWHRYRKTHPRQHALPAVLAVVVHHGPGGPWRVPTRLEELSTLPPALRAAVARYSLAAEILLDDLSAQSERALRQRRLSPTVTLTLWMLAHARTSPDLPAALRGVADLAAKVAREPGGLDTLALLVRYSFEVTALAPETIIEALTMKAGNRIRKKLETTADRLREEGRLQGLEEGRETGRKEGRQEGREEGLAKGLQQLLVLQLQDRFGALPAAVTRRVRKADRPAIELWARRILSARSLEEVFAEAPPPPPTSRRVLKPASQAAPRRRARSLPARTATKNS